ncbi:hypothetical protein FIBSPDRAFT_725138 [Athelia psychrophila]|uniref:hAT-like transposase RNase-H fold domain-containing protein n=1 Tax=Athelia psychrophila TaxID=1759441 RepID=A0A165X3K5_9AGAM|nr:hypothetical protein FIBSPDRAFT_761846 [Fibularhizoctonia sp. CBS 109695]KZP31108.1 hypothetical protein FIBSPDRAFT_725138 [Fibularhizoctonia sp. CBS 109695]
MDVLARVLGTLLSERYGLTFHSDNARIRCLAHIVNIIVQTILKQFDEADDPDLTDYYETMKNLPVHYSPEDDEDLQEMEREAFEDIGNAMCDEEEESSESELTEDTALLSPVKKLRAIVNKIVSSPQRRKYFKKCAAQRYADLVSEKGTKIAMLMVIRDAVDDWVFQHETLRPLMLSNSEWTLLEQLGSVLEIFTRVTLEMSRAGTPTLPWAIPCYHLMETALTKTSEDSTLPAKLRLAIDAGITRLRHYYKIALSNHYNVIATVCHPTLRLGFFKKLGDDEHTRAEIIFKTVYQEYEAAAASRPRKPPPPPIPSHSLSSFLSELALVNSNADSDDPPEQEIASEWDRYLLLRHGGAGRAEDPLGWWKVCTYFIFFSLSECTNDTHCSHTNTSSPSLQRWLVITLQFQGQVCVSSDFFRSPVTFAPISVALCALRRLQRPCVPVNGFAVASWSLIRIHIISYTCTLYNYRLH